MQICPGIVVAVIEARPPALSPSEPRRRWTERSSFRSRSWVQNMAANWPLPGATAEPLIPVVDAVLRMLGYQQRRAEAAAAVAGNDHPGCVAAGPRIVVLLVAFEGGRRSCRRPTSTPAPSPRSRSARASPRPSSRSRSGPRRRRPPGVGGYAGSLPSPDRRGTLWIGTVEPGGQQEQSSRLRLDQFPAGERAGHAVPGRRQIQGYLPPGAAAVVRAAQAQRGVGGIFSSVPAENSSARPPDSNSTSVAKQVAFPEGRLLRGVIDQALVFQVHGDPLGTRWQLNRFFAGEYSRPGRPSPPSASFWWGPVAGTKRSGGCRKVSEANGAPGRRSRPCPRHP